MQYLFRSLAVLTLFLQTTQAAEPLFIEKFSFTNRVMELKAFNNAGDILLNYTEPDPSGNGSSREIPALLRAGNLIKLHPVGTPNIQITFGNGISQVRDDGGLFVAGTALMLDGFWRAALWAIATDGTFDFRTMPNVVLPPDSSAPGEQLKSYGLAVNRSGVLVGSADSYLAGLAAIWEPPYNNVVVYLLSTGSSFQAVSDSGLLAANGVEIDHNNANVRYAAAVTVAGGIPNEVPLLSLPPSTLWPNSINSMSGEWVAGYNHLLTSTRAIAWKIGSSTTIDLPSPAGAGTEEHEIKQAQSINSSGHAVGYYNGGNHSVNPILWHYSGSQHTAYFLNELIVGEPYPNYRVEHNILNNDQNEVAFVTRDWNGMVLKVYSPVTNGFVEFVTEGVWTQEEAGSAEFRLKLQRAFGNDDPITVHYETVAETAIAEVHYTAAISSITWLPGESGEKTIAIPLHDNLTVDNDRTFRLRLTGASGAQLGKTRESLCTISDPYQDFFPRNQMSSGWFYGCLVLQGQANAILNIERSGGTDGAITFTNFQASAVGSEPGIVVDIPSSLKISWGAGESEVKRISLPILQTDLAITEPKTFNITASGAYEGSDREGHLSATVVILPNATAAPPKINSDLFQRLAQNLSFAISAVQGTTIQLERSVNDLDSWTVATELRSEDGEVLLGVPLNLADQASFFRIKVKE